MIFVINISINVLCTGKCYPCLIFSFLCGKYRDGKRREIVRELQVLHQSTYMGERFDYYKRREDSLSHPAQFLSDISDGMAGSKTVIPSFSDQLESSNTLKIHVRRNYLGFNVDRI